MRGEPHALLATMPGIRAVSGESGPAGRTRPTQPGSGADSRVDGGGAEPRGRWNDAVHVPQVEGRAGTDRWTHGITARAVRGTPQARARWKAATACSRACAGERATARGRIRVSHGSSVLACRWKVGDEVAAHWVNREALAHGPVCHARAAQVGLPAVADGRLSKVASRGAEWSQPERVEVRSTVAAAKTPVAHNVDSGGFRVVDNRGFGKGVTRDGHAFDRRRAGVFEVTWRQVSYY